ncbi:TPA: hypothetical protein DEP90_01505 [Patescibacteria group bacterium]|nr:hypothetical protein [Patescibacteria group bacterium]
MKKNIFIKKLSNIYVILGFVFLGISLIVIAIPVSPYILYRLNPDFTNDEIDNISQKVFEDPIIPVEVEETGHTLPDFNPSLPEEPYVVISRIGVYSPIGESSNPEDSLRNGTWMVSDYGTPEDSSLPIILAAHRFGYVYWDHTTRDKLSFFNLSKTKIGDSVIIIWNQREYIYKIYAEDEATFIKDYEADLILYTCKYFNSPHRIFRYANRVN